MGKPPGGLSDPMGPQEGRYKALFEGSRDAILEMDPSGAILAANPSACRLFDMAMDEICRGDRAMLVDPQDPRLAVLEEKLARSEGAFGSLTFLRKDGTSFEGEYSAGNHQTEGGARASLIIRDVSVRSRMETEREAYLNGVNRAALFAKIAFWEFDLQTGARRWSEEAHQIFAIDPTYEPLGREVVLQRIHPDDRKRVELAIDAAMEGRENYNVEFRLLTPEGRTRWIQSLGDLELDANGKPVRIFGMAQDITDRMEVLNALGEREELLTRTGEMAKVGGWEFDVETGEGTWTPEVARIHDLDPRAPTDMAFGISFYHGSSREAVEGAIHEAIHRGKSYDMELELTTVLGRKKWVRTVGRPVMREGRVVKLEGSFQDITELKRAGQALEASEERLKLALRAANQGLYDLNLQSGEAVVSEEYARMLGFDPGTFVETNQAWRERLHPDDRENAIRVFEDYIAGRRDDYEAEFRQRTRDGGWKWILSVGKILEWDQEGRPFRMLGIHADCTQRREVEEALLESEDRFRHVFEAANVGKSITSLDGKVSANRAFADLLGYPLGELEGKSWQELTPAEDIEEVQAILDPLLRGEVDSARFPKRYLRKDGTLIWADISVVLRRDDDGRPMHFITNLVDITEHVEAEASLKLSEERLRLATKAANVAVWEYDFSTNSMSRTRNHDTLYGLDWQESWDLNTFLSATHPDDRSLSAEIIQRSVTPGGPDDYGFDFRVVQSDGSIRWLAVDGHVVERDPEGRGMLVRGCLIDVTDRKSVEEELRNSERRFSDVFRVGPAGMTISKIADGTFLEANEAFCEMFGFSREEIVGRTSLELNMLTPQGRRDLIQAQVESGGLRSKEQEARARDGRILKLLFSSTPILLEGEACHVTTMVDITERKLAEEALRESEERYRTLVEASPFAIGVHQDGILAFLNPAAARLLGGKEPEELLGLSLPDLVAPGNLDAARDRIRRMLEGEEGLYPVEDRYLRLDGTEIPVEVTAARCTFNGRPAIQVVALDLSQVKRAEEALKESEIRLRSIFESSPLGIVLVDVSGRIVAANPAFCHMLERPEAEVLALDPVALTHPQDKKETALRTNRLQSGEEQGFAWEKRYLSKSGETIWARVTTAPILDDEGSFLYSVALIEDIRNRMAMEEDLKHSRTQLRALASRLEEIREEEKRSIARELHDVLGQALTSLRMDLRLFQSELPSEDPWPGRIDELVVSVDKGVDLVRELSARLRPPILDVMGLAAAVDWLTDQWESRTTLDFRLDLEQGPLGLTKDQETAIFRVIQESLTNIQRHAQAREVRIGLEKIAKGIQVEIRDDGIGIPPDALDRVSSLGLVGMRERALALGGALEISQGPTRGTRVCLFVPTPTG